MTKQELFETIWADMVEETKKADEESEKLVHADLADYDVAKANYSTGTHAGLVIALQVLMKHFKESRDL